MTSAISPVLLHPPPDRKKLVVWPSQKALQVSSTLTLTPTVVLSQAIDSHFFARLRTRFSWKKALRSAGVEAPLPN